MRRLAVVIATLASASAGACGPYGHCAAPANARDLPARLSETGLWADGARAVAVSNRPYRPRFELWSDGARKRRWIRLPHGRTIDTHDMDDWELPPGTTLWKEFSSSGRRLETRMLRRSEAGDWAGVAYVWNDEQTDAFAAPQGALDPLGVAHVVPSAGECNACHAGRRSFVLGFSAVQLAHDAPDEEELTLARAVSAGLLSRPPIAPIGLVGDDDDHEALGYLHANCGHCHNGGGPRKDCFTPPRRLDLWLRAADSDPAQTHTVQSLRLDGAIDVAAPDESRILDRMTHAGVFTRRMPPLGTTRADEEALAVLRRWIAKGRSK